MHWSRLHGAPIAQLSRMASERCLPWGETRPRTRPEQGCAHSLRSAPHSWAGSPRGRRSALGSRSSPCICIPVPPKRCTQRGCWTPWGAPCWAHLDVQVRSRINQHLDHGFVPGGAGVHQRRQTLRESKADAKPPGNGRSRVLHRPLSRKPQLVCWTQLLTLSSPASWLDLLPLPGPLDTHPVRRGSRAQAPKPDRDAEATSAMGSCKPCPGHSSLCLSFFFKMRTTTASSSDGCRKDDE